MSPTMAEALERLKLLARACDVTGMDHLPIVARENAARFAADLRVVLAALSQPARPVNGERERIARIIDPKAADHEAAQATRSSSDRNLHHSPSLFGRRAEALAKADAILNPQDKENDNG